MPACEHIRTEFMMRRDAVDYVRCLGCDQVFEEADWLEMRAPASTAEDGEEKPAEHPRRKKAS